MITREEIEKLGFTFERQTESGIEYYWIKFLPTSECDILYRLDNIFTLQTKPTKTGHTTDWFSRMEANTIDELHFILSRSRLGLKFKPSDFFFDVTRKNKIK